MLHDGLNMGEQLGRKWDSTACSSHTSPPSTGGPQNQISRDKLIWLKIAVSVYSWGEQV